MEEIIHVLVHAAGLLGAGMAAVLVIVVGRLRDRLEQTEKRVRAQIRVLARHQPGSSKWGLHWLRFFGIGSQERVDMEEEK